MWSNDVTELLRVGRVSEINPVTTTLGIKLKWTPGRYLLALPLINISIWFTQQQICDVEFGTHSLKEGPGAIHENIFIVFILFLGIIAQHDVGAASHSAAPISLWWIKLSFLRIHDLWSTISVRPGNCRGSAICSLSESIRTTSTTTTKSKTPFIVQRSVWSPVPSPLKISARCSSGILLFSRSSNFTGRSESCTEFMESFSTFLEEIQEEQKLLFFFQFLKKIQTQYLFLLFCTSSIYRTGWWWSRWHENSQQPIPLEEARLLGICSSRRSESWLQGRGSSYPLRASKPLHRSLQIRSSGSCRTTHVFNCVTNDVLYGIFSKSAIEISSTCIYIIYNYIFDYWKIFIIYLATNSICIDLVFVTQIVNFLIIGS